MITIHLRESIRAYEHRTKKRLTYAAIAELAGLSRETIASLASRDGHNTRLSTIDKLCEVLGCDIWKLISRSAKSGAIRRKREQTLRHEFRAQH